MGSKRGGGRGGASYWAGRVGYGSRRNEGGGAPGVGGGGGAKGGGGPGGGPFPGGAGLGTVLGGPLEVFNHGVVVDAAQHLLLDQAKLLAGG